MTAWKLSCADYTFPALEHAQALRLIADLGFDGVDVGFFAGRSHVRPDHNLRDPIASGQQLGAAVGETGLAIADLFAQISDDFRVDSINDPVLEIRDAAIDALTQCLDVAAAAEAPGVTILPGVQHEGEEWEVSFWRSVEALTRLVDVAAARGLRLSFEPHIESLVEAPDRALALVTEVPGLGVTLDPAHFVFSGHGPEQMEGLLGRVAHVQLRGGAPGVLQAPLSENVIDFNLLQDTLVRAGYEGWLATEYVWSSWHGCDRVDNVTETVGLRDVLRGRGDSLPR